MSATIFNEKERLRRDLFSGSLTLRERALRHFEPEKRDKIRDLIKTQKDALRLLDVMMSDLAHAGAEMRKDSNSQFWRRTAIRTLAATVDGIIFSLKQVALDSNRLIGGTLTEKEMNFLREKSLTPGGEKVRFLPFRDNFKDAFKLFAKTYGTGCPTDFGQDGFSALCDTIELRHRITHPKSFMTFCVQDGEKERAAVAIDWLAKELKELLRVSVESNAAKDRTSQPAATS